jgi:hypothetical protein
MSELIDAKIREYDGDTRPIESMDYLSSKIDYFLEVPDKICNLYSRILNILKGVISEDGTQEYTNVNCDIKKLANLEKSGREINDDLKRAIGMTFYNRTTAKQFRWGGQIAIPRPKQLSCPIVESLQRRLSQFLRDTALFVKDIEINWKDNERYKTIAKIFALISLQLTEIKERQILKAREDIAAITRKIESNNDCLAEACSRLRQISARYCEVSNLAKERARKIEMIEEACQSARLIGVEKGRLDSQQSDSDNSELIKKLEGQVEGYTSELERAIALESEAKAASFREPSYQEEIQKLNKELERLRDISIEEERKLKQSTKEERKNMNEGRKSLEKKIEALKAKKKQQFIKLQTSQKYVSELQKKLDMLNEQLRDKDNSQTFELDVSIDSIPEMQAQLDLFTEQLEAKNRLLIQNEEKLRQANEIGRELQRSIQSEHLSDDFIESQILGSILQRQPIELDMHGLKQKNVEEYLEKVLLYFNRLRSDKSLFYMRDLGLSNPMQVAFITGCTHGVVLRDKLMKQLNAKGITYYVPTNNQGIVKTDI